MVDDGSVLDHLRLSLVDDRADLRRARQDLVRRKRQVTVSIAPAGRTAKERETSLDLQIHADPQVCALEDEILVLQHREDLHQAQLENGLRPLREQEWFIREKQADAHNNLAAAISSNPNMTYLIALMGPPPDDTYLGTSEYLKERMLG